MSTAQPPNAEGLQALRDLVGRVADRSLGIDVAKERAQALGATGRLPGDMIAALGHTALDLASAGRWRDGVLMAEVAFATAAGARDALAAGAREEQVWLLMGADLIEVLHVGLASEGDIRLYLRAHEVLAATVERAAAIAPQIQGLLEYRLGTLILDCYVGGRSPSNHENEFAAWVARAVQSNDPDLIWRMGTPVGQDGEPGPARSQWAEPAQALTDAERHLRAALALVIPERRGAVLKALAQLTEWRGMIGGASDPEEVRRLAIQALEALDPDDAQARLAVIGMLERLDGSSAVDHEELIAVLERDWERYRDEHTPQIAWDALGQGAMLLQERDPVRGLALVRRQREITEVWSDEALRGNHYRLECELFSRAYGSTRGYAHDNFDGATARAAGEAQAARSPEAARAAAASIAGVMLASTGLESEGSALALLDLLTSLDTTLWEEHVPAIGVMVAQLCLGEGVNRFRAGEIDVAASFYRRAAGLLRDYGMTVPAVQCLGSLDDLVHRGVTELDELTAWVVTESLPFELAAPAGAPPAIQGLVAGLVARQAHRGTSPEVVHALFQVAAGRRFAAMLSAGTRGFALDDHAERLLAREAEAEAALPPTSSLLRPMAFDAALGDDDLIVAWVDEYEQGPMETPEDEVAAVQRALERHLASVLVPHDVPPMSTLAEVQATLDPRTALIVLYEGAWVDGRAATWQLLVTRDFAEVAVGVAEMPYGAVSSEWRGRQVTMAPTGYYVSAMRKGVQADPGPFDIDPDAAESLAGARGHYLNVLDTHADKLRAAGVDRLVIAPFGPSRYLPLHLTGPEARPLATDWTVSYVISLAQLRGGARARPRREGVAVFALSYADQPGLAPLNDSAAEAHAIAATCGVTPKLDAEATEPAFAHALETARYVHLRAHGRLYVDAPTFQTVFLHPSEGHDGRLRAYEVLPLDLEGLELVTLGACETALGRVDRADNPRGLPAALLLAGAGAVIGTLWPVLAEASTCFFTALYARLADGEADLRDAFAEAQTTTRRDFPQYRDWGAFYLMGGCTA